MFRKIQTVRAQIPHNTFQVLCFTAGFKTDTSSNLPNYLHILLGQYSADLPIMSLIMCPISTHRFILTFFLLLTT